MPATKLVQLEERIAHFEELEKGSTGIKGIFQQAVNSIGILQKQSDNIAAKAAMKQIDAAIDKIPNQVKDLVGSLAAQIFEERASKQFEALQQGSAGLLSQIGAAEARHAEMLSQIKAAEARYAGLLSQIGAVEARHAGLLSQIEMAEQRNGEMLNQIEASIGRNAELQSQLQTLEKQNIQLMQQLQEVDRRNREVELVLPDFEKLAASMAPMEKRLNAIEELLPSLAKALHEQEQPANNSAMLEQLASASSGVQLLGMRQVEIQTEVGRLDEHINRILAWLRDESIRPDIDRLDTELILTKDKFASMETALLRFAREMVQFNEFEERFNQLSSEIMRVQQMVAPHNGKSSSADDKIVRMEKEMEKLKTDVVWGIKELRQRIDTLLSEIRRDLFEEEKKRFEKVLQIEVEHQKQARTANSLHAEVTSIKRALSATMSRAGELENRTAKVQLQ